ncbi:hypothetical protein [Burkholderia anthina]|uniref:hypothetical protein n=1 Tax=Burkholderia anthina TaxID=179879 RepID=UPI00158A71BC|nr:hypothetical protein [Burkholderia anthina]
MKPERNQKVSGDADRSFPQRGYGEREAVFQMRNALRSLSKVACRVPTKAAAAALREADVAFLGSFDRTEKRYVLSEALAWRETLAPGQYLREAKIENFEDVVLEMGLAYVHSVISKYQEAYTEGRLAKEIQQMTELPVTIPTTLSRKAMGGRLSFEIGALNREALEELAADLRINVDKWTATDDLRSDVLARYLEQGEPHQKFEYASSFWGSGEHSGPTETAYVPESLITATCEDVAFGKFAHIDPIHIVSSDSDDRFTSSGVAFVGIELYRSAATGQAQLERSETFGELLDDAKELRDMKVDLNTDNSTEDHQR